jgi:hypothetical protein
MGQVLHRSASTTEAIRRAIQNSQESLSAILQADWYKRKTRYLIETAGFCWLREPDLN